MAATATKEGADGTATTKREVEQIVGDEGLGCAGSMATDRRVEAEGTWRGRWKSGNWENAIEG